VIYRVVTQHVHPCLLGSQNLMRDAVVDNSMGVPNAIIERRKVQGIAAV
jgi:hypothetical protein